MQLWKRFWKSAFRQLPFPKCCSGGSLIISLGKIFHTADYKRKTFHRRFGRATRTLGFNHFLALSNGQCTVRIGPNAISFHRAAPYDGWSVFHPQIEEMITGLFQKADKLTVNRLGLRYLNALQTDLHGIGSILNLDLKMSVEDQSISGHANLNFTSDVADNTACTVRIATPEFVQGLLLQRPQASVYIDVDVFTKEPFETRAEQDVQAWVTTAHASEKDQFFRLLTEEKIKELRED